MNIKRFLLAGLAVIVLSTPALAAILVRQNGDGTADYVGSQGDTMACLGQAIVPTTTFRLDLLSTGVAVNPITNAIIRNIWVVRNGSTTASPAKIRFWATPYILSNQGSTGLLTPISFYGLSGASTVVLSHATINFNAGGISKVGVISTLAQAGASHLVWGNVSDFGLPANNYLAVQSDGGSTGAVTGQAFFQLCPR